MACELTSTCIFFNDQMQGKPGMLALYKAQYCHGDNANCARYMVFIAMGRENVPRDMYPNDRLRALRMVRSARGVITNSAGPSAAQTNDDRR